MKVFFSLLKWTIKRDNKIPETNIKERYFRESTLYILTIKISGCQRMEWEQLLTTIGHISFLEVMKMFYTMILLVVTWLYTFARTHRTSHFKSKNCTVFKLYLTNLKKKITKGFPTINFHCFILQFLAPNTFEICHFLCPTRPHSICYYFFRKLISPKLFL